MPVIPADMVWSGSDSKGARVFLRWSPKEKGLPVEEEQSLMYFLLIHGSLELLSLETPQGYGSLYEIWGSFQVLLTVEMQTLP